VTFFCKTPWKNSIVLIFESLINISESPLQNIKIKQLDTNTSQYTFVIPYRNSIIRNSIDQDEQNIDNYV
jgi:hypothetical protein